MAKKYETISSGINPYLLKKIDDDFIYLYENVGKVNEMVERSKNTLEEAERINAEYESTNDRLDNIIADSGTSSTEVVDARLDAEGYEYPVLKERLDSQDKYVDTARYEASQPDYVDLLSKYNNFDNIQLHKINNHIFEISVFNKDTHITYQLQYNNDDYLIQSRIWAGALVEETAQTDGVNVSDFTLEGSYVGPSNELTGYTTTVGDTFEHNFTIEEDGAISLQFFKSSSGGLWRIYIDGIAIKDLSVFSSTSTMSMEFISNVQAGAHTISGEFLGEDPNNAPSNSPARGWLQNTNRDFLIIGRRVITPSKDITITEPSNKEFAFNIMPEGGTFHQFVPFHGEPTAVEASPPVFKDGNKVIDIKGISFSQTIAIDNFSLEQHVYGRHPESGEKNLLEIWTTTKINKNTGILSVDGKKKVVEPVNFRNSYVIMGPVRGDQFDTVVSSYGNQYIAGASSYGTNIQMPEERDHATSYLMISSENKELAFAFRFNNPKETLRQGEPSKDENPEVMTYINNRNATVKKIYSRLYNDYDAMAGEVMRFSGDYLPVVGSNIYDLYSL